jgi:hypothetical protein
LKPIVTRVTDYHPLGDGLYLESNDLSNPLEADPAGFDMLGENLTFFNVDDDNLQYMWFDPFEIFHELPTFAEILYELPTRPK